MFTAYNEIKKITIIENKIIFGETFKMWNKKNRNNVVAKDPNVPGIFLIFPIPNKVTNKKLILLSIFYNWSYHLTGYSFFFSY